MALPPEDASAREEPGAPRPDLQLIEASQAKERRCADCGRRTEDWRPVRRKGVVVLLCRDCAAKPPPAEESPTCPQCGAALGSVDSFCGKCGTRILYACSQCGASLDPEDIFCGKCGARFA